MASVINLKILVALREAIFDSDLGSREFLLFSLLPPPSSLDFFLAVHLLVYAVSARTCTSSVYTLGGGNRAYRVFLPCK